LRVWPEINLKAQSALQLTSEFLRALQESRQSCHRLSGLFCHHRGQRQYRQHENEREATQDEQRCPAAFQALADEVINRGADEIEKSRVSKKTRTISTPTW
jgi:hypothetical protein